MPIQVSVVTTARSDYSLLYWVLHDLFADARFAVKLVVGGSHLSDKHGSTVREIERDGWPIATRIPFGDEPDAGRELGAALTGFSDFFRREPFDVVVLCADRYELLPIASAAVVHRTPIAHLYGGDVTEGAIDEQVRHGVTKLAHLHFPATEKSARRILQMGEESWRVHSVGDPALDQFVRGTRATRDELERELGLGLDGRTLLVTLHPTTLHLESVQRDAEELAAALVQHEGGVIITGPAPDAGAEIIEAQLKRLAAMRPKTVFRQSLGGHLYRGLLHHVGALVGNSSSGLVEAPCVPVPAVNIGDRQKGRERTRNVVDVPADRAAIHGAISRVLSPAFRDSLTDLVKPGDGLASKRLVNVLGDLPERSRLLTKKFVLLDAGPTASGTIRPMGGDFPIELPDVCSGSEGLWATGRDALATILEPLAPIQGGRWLVPEFICRVVPDTLRALGRRVEPYPLITPWRPNPDALARLLPGAEGIIVPYYLGLDPSAAVWELLKGTSVIAVEDRCQSPCPAPRPEDLKGFAAIGSFRKWLPVPDGAYCVGRRPLPEPTAPPRRQMVSLRLSAAILKAQRLANPTSPDEPVLERMSVDLYRLGEKSVGAAVLSARASALAQRIIAATDMEHVRSTRLRNQRWLAERLPSNGAVRILQDHPEALLKAEQPLLALPLLCEDRETTWQRLANRGIFCAVHWRDGDWSNRGGAPARWSAQVLSLPIDQRYELADLQRVLDAL